MNTCDKKKKDRKMSITEKQLETLRRGCLGKAQYINKKRAVKVMNRRINYLNKYNQNHNLNVYECELCGAWHIGNRREYYDNQSFQRKFVKNLMPQAIHS